MDATRIEARAVVKVAAISLAVLAAAVLLALVVLHTRTTIRWVFAALFLALALLPAVDLVERRLRWRGRGLPRWLAIVVVYVLVALGFTFLVLQVIPPIVREIEALAGQAPGWVEDFRRWAEGSGAFQELNQKYDLIATLKQQAAGVPARLGDAAGEVQSITVSLLTNLVAAITILALAFFLLLDGRQHASRLADRFERPTAERLRRIGTRIAAIVKGYVSVNLLLAVGAGVFTWIVLSILGVDLAVPLAVMVGFFDLVPLVGFTVGGVLVAAVAALHSLGALLAWIAAFLVYQQLQDRVIQPLLYANAVRVHPAVAIVAILAGAQLAGILGALLAIPAAAIAGVLLDEWLGYRRESAPGAALAEPVD